MSHPSVSHALYTDMGALDVENIHKRETPHEAKCHTLHMQVHERCDSARLPCYVYWVKQI
jgi:hypothetical protein